MRKVAIFDIDGTIFRSSLLIELTDGLIQAGIFSTKVRDEYARVYKKWLERKGSYENYIAAVVQAFDKNIKGKKYGDYYDVVKKVVAFHKNRIYRHTRDLVRELKDKNYFLLAISHSPREMVYEFGKKMGFDKVYGRMREVDARGVFTGKTLFLDLISDKAKILNRAILRNNLTLKGSVGVGDTESDIRFLKLVEKPTCFNPNKKLYDYAKRNGWKIVVERKDVIYNL